MRSAHAGQYTRQSHFTGVRLTHIPTGIIAVNNDRPSHNGNLKAALIKLEQKLHKHDHTSVSREHTMVSDTAVRKSLKNALKKDRDNI